MTSQTPKEKIYKRIYKWWDEAPTFVQYTTFGFLILSSVAAVVGLGFLVFCVIPIIILQIIGIILGIIGGSFLIGGLILSDFL